MAVYFVIIYTYRFANDTVKKFELALDKGTLALVTERRKDLPEWTLLEYHQCANCPLKRMTHTHCPVAANLSGIAWEFKDVASLEHVAVTVTVEERTYFKNTTMQHGLSPLLGIIMATSGCPVLDPLKPMVRFHLPFASLDETVFRMVSMHLVAQFIRHQEGKTASWTLDGLTRIYAEVGKVNKEFAQRMQAAARSDANVNALVNLDVFAKMVPLLAEDMLKQLKPYFLAHLR